jgi:hypothetical protein
MPALQLFIAFPNEDHTRCLAAEGFSAYQSLWQVEPCPFAPFSDTDLRFETLRDALQSKFLRLIRENHKLLKEGEGGCALWSNRDWVRKILG